MIKESVNLIGEGCASRMRIKLMFMPAIKVFGYARNQSVGQQQKIQIFKKFQSHLYPGLLLLSRIGTSQPWKNSWTRPGPNRSNFTFEAQVISNWWQHVVRFANRELRRRGLQIWLAPPGRTGEEVVRSFSEVQNDTFPIQFATTVHGRDSGRVSHNSYSWQKRRRQPSAKDKNIEIRHSCLAAETFRRHSSLHTRNLRGPA